MGERKYVGKMCKKYLLFIESWEDRKGHGNFIYRGLVWLPAH